MSDLTAYFTSLQAKLPAPFELRFHSAMPKWAKIIGLRVKHVQACEGGGFAVDINQARAIALADTVPALVIALNELERQSGETNPDTITKWFEARKAARAVLEQIRERIRT